MFKISFIHGYSVAPNLNNASISSGVPILLARSINCGNVRSNSVALLTAIWASFGSCATRDSIAGP